MLTEIIKMLLVCLSATGAPVYQADCVPENTAAPYITLQTTAPGTLTLTAWHTTNAGRIALGESIARLLPSRGSCFPTTSGQTTLVGSTTTFVQEGPLLGLRMVWKMRFFPAA